MGDRMIPSTCSECGASLDDGYEVEVYHVTNPAQSGYHNPVVRWALGSLWGNTVDMHYPTCAGCEPPATPSKPDVRPHRHHFAQSALGALFTAWMATSPSATMTSSVIGFAAVASVALAAVAAGELLQLQRIQAHDEPLMRSHEPRLANPSTPEQRIHEAYLDDEIDENDLDEYFDAEFDDEISDDELDELVEELLDTDNEERELVVEQ